ncbi:hypothetical protein GALMADRAFT_562975 [Galerina marginata CBS 339.88]|uniref:Uncharacterized protein n=1 Tax=Galerina marginata (strain CBS 339.88) TaxID=685588 RepID=A0A067SV69_GALM3|nr:hypothetical protein GALMADRAFT_562975 [Galerina marginata CBS 339.88]
MTEMRYGKPIPDDAIAELRNPALKSYYDMNDEEDDTRDKNKSSQRLRRSTRPGRWYPRQRRRSMEHGAQ